jgi:hypothetical protein
LEFGAALDVSGMAGVAVSVDGLFGEVIGTATGSAEDEPAIALKS